MEETAKKKEKEMLERIGSGDGKTRMGEEEETITEEEEEWQLEQQRIEVSESHISCFTPYPSEQVCTQGQWFLNPLSNQALAAG